MDWKPLRKFVPGNAARRIPAGNPACPLNGHDVFRALAPRKVIVMACNIRIPSVIPGIMRAAEELGAVVAFELAKSEGDLAGGYTGMTPEIFASTIFDCAKRTGFSLPFLIHGDHITVKNTSEKEVEGSRALIAAEIEAGYTCFAIDASFNPIPDNARIVADLSRPITERGLGLEVEVGEIKAAGSEGALSTVEEAVELMERLAVYGRFGVSIAQHGITGTPLHLVGRFADYGIRKGNVGTQWQNVAHAGLPPALMGKMRDWAKAAGKVNTAVTLPLTLTVCVLSASAI